MNHRRAALIALLAFCPWSGLAGAGPLTPPSGTIASTMKTLQQVEPRTPLSAATTPGDSDSIYRITQPGSYYLTEMMTVPSGFNGIEITASYVTLDLSGMTIRGLPGSKDGISNLNTDNTNLVIRNGTVREMGSNGVHFSSVAITSPCGHTIERVSAIGNGGFGIVIPDGTVTSSAAHHNAAAGIRTTSVFSGSIVNCSASNNTDGLSVGTGSVLNSTAELNREAGIRVGQSGLITGCVSSSNKFGFSGANYHITNSTARDNSSYGIVANIGLTAIDNLVISGTISASTIGIWTSNTGSRIEGNNIVRQGTAIRVSDVGNLVVGNTLRANFSAADIVAGNRVGTLVTAPAMGAISGNTGGGSVGSADPNANVLY